MKQSLLVRLRANGIKYVISALLLLLGIPLYQIFLLTPAGLSAALDAASNGHFATYLSWLHQHSLYYLLYRLLLVIVYILLWTFPFSLFRIIAAQEILGIEEGVTQDDDGEDDEVDEEPDDASITTNEEVTPENSDGMPAYAWRGRGFLVIAAWAGMCGLVLYLLGTILSTLYLVFLTGNSDTGTASTISSIFTIITNTVGSGLIGLSILFFGAMICRTGTRLWPGSWVALGYAGIVAGGLLCVSAIAVAGAPGSGQNPLTTAATLLMAIWLLWLGILLARLKAEA